MKKFIIKRLVQLIPIIIGITLLSFLLVNVSNTDAIDMLEANRGTAISEEQKNELREELGLDQPVIVRYVVWLKGVITAIWVIPIYQESPCLQHLYQSFQRLYIYVWFQYY